MTKLRLASALIFCLLTVVSTLSAQELRVGARGGVNNTDVSLEGSFLESTSSKTSFHAGLVLSAIMSSAIELQTGAWLSKKGFEGTGGIGGATDVSQTYIEIPMLFGLRLPWAISPHVLVGPVLSIETSCKLSTQGPQPVQGVDCDDVSDGPRTKGADFGFLFGGGIELKAGRFVLAGDVFYNLGLTDISEPGGSVDSINNRALYLSLAALWPIGGRRVEENVPELP